jgi:hypothetical protein
MSMKKQYQISMKQRKKRKAKRDHLAAKGQDLTGYYYGKYFIKLGQ